jgi:hypothetical protein
MAVHVVPSPQTVHPAATNKFIGEVGALPRLILSVHFRYFGDSYFHSATASLWSLTNACSRALAVVIQIELFGHF